MTCSDHCEPRSNRKSMQCARCPISRLSGTGFPQQPQSRPDILSPLFLPELNEAAIAAIAAATQDAPRTFMVLIVNFRGAVTRVRPTDMAFAMRQPGYEVDVFGNWSARQEKDSAVRWVIALRDKLQPFSQGLYVNGLSETSDELVRAAYGPNHARLVEIKKKYDPNNVLRLNQNIRPNSPLNS
jgi:hypothetical protein